VAIYHFSMSPVSRKEGRSVVAAMAYRAGALIHDERTGKTHDYLRKGGILNTLLVLPEGRDNTVNRAEFWNSIEKHHKRGDAVLGREIECSLPSELTPAQRERLAFDYARELADRYGAAVDVCLHAPREFTDEELLANPEQIFIKEADGTKHNGNGHGHFMLSACSVSPDGVLGKKVNELDPIHCARHKIQNAAEFERARWADLVNEALREAGHDVRVDHRSLEAQGITDRAPQAHRGPSVSAMIRKGKQTDHQARELARQDEAAKIASAVEQAQAVIDDLNNQLAELQAQAAAEAELEALQRDQEQAEAERMAEKAFMQRAGWGVEDDHHDDDDGEDASESLSERALRLRVEAKRLEKLAAQCRRPPTPPTREKVKYETPVKISTGSFSGRSITLEAVRELQRVAEAELSNRQEQHSEKGFLRRLVESKELKAAREKLIEVNDLSNTVERALGTEKAEKIIDGKFDGLLSIYESDLESYSQWDKEVSGLLDACELAAGAEREARLEMERLHPDLVAQERAAVSYGLGV